MMRLLARLTRFVFKLLVLAVVVLMVAAVFQNVSPLTADEIRRKSDEANQSAAVNVPHGFDNGAHRNAALDLFTKVERNQELSDAESARYRVAYQTIIFEKQSTLRRFDSSLTVLADVEMDRPNNVGGSGISGHHDHHDASVRANLASLTRELAALDGAPVLRARFGALAYKDLSDILAHLGTVPHTKSTPYRAPDRPLGEIERLGEESLRAFKAAQFARVNSRDYWTAVFAGLDRFDQLAAAVQQTVNSKLNPLEQRISGRWGGVPSLGPWLLVSSEPRRRRAAN